MNEYVKLLEIYFNISRRLLTGDTVSEREREKLAEATNLINKYLDESVTVTRTLVYTGTRRKVDSTLSSSYLPLEFGDLQIKETERKYEI